MSDRSAARQRLAALRRAGDAGLAPLSSAQQRMWLAAQSVPGLSAYHICRVLRLDGPLDVVALTTALTEQVDRHEALRTGVLTVDGQPLQRVNPPGRFTLDTVDLSDRSDPDVVADEWTAAALREPLPLDGTPLLRAGLLRLDGVRHRLVLVVHHLVADAWSLDLLLRDLAAAYRVVVAGNGQRRESVPAYRAHVERERAFAASPAGREQVAYWTEQLRGITPLELPTTRARSAAPVRHGGLADVLIPTETADVLRRLGHTLTPVLLAAYGLVLHRFTGQDDLVVGLPASRRDERFADAVGLFVGVLPIRLSFAGGTPFADTARQTAATMLTALDNAAVPMEQVVQQLAPVREPGRNALFDVTFGVLPPSAAGELELPGLQVAVDRVYGGHAKFDLHLEFRDDGPGTPLSGELEYDTDLFSAEFARALLSAYQILLTAVAADPMATVAELPLTTPSTAADGTGDYLPTPVRIDALFAGLADAQPDRIALLAPDGTRLSYGQLAQRMRQTAAMLRELGVRPGDFVGLALPRGVSLVEATLGVLHAGAAYVPLDLAYPLARLAGMVTDAGVRLVLAEPGTGLDLPVPVAGFPSARLAEADFEPAPSGPARLDPAPADKRGDAPAYVMFTSGSTGRPKAVVVTHRGVVRLAQDPEYADRRWLHAAAPVFDAATLEMWTPLLSGGSLLVVPGQPTVADLGALIADHGVEIAFLTTGLFNVVVDEDVTVLAPLRQVLTGGDVMSPDHVRRALSVVDTVVNYYGPTENTTATTGHRLAAGQPVPDDVPIGIPLRGTTVHIVDQYLQPLPPGVPGEILTGGDGLALGYAGDPARTAERFVPDPFGPPGSRLYRTGDFGRSDAHGRIRFGGRRDDQVKVRGFRIELAEVENAAAAHPQVHQAAVIAHTDPAGDKRLVGFVTGDCDPASLPGFLRGLLPAYSVPNEWISMPRLPLGVGGKVDRRALARHAAELVTRPAEAPVAHEPSLVEQLLAAWFVDLLGIAEARPGTDFFAAGGHSLLAARLAARIRAAFGVELPLAAVFATPRLGDLAEAVMSAPRTGTVPLTASVTSGRAPMSYAQERLWFLEQYAPGSPQYHVPLALRLTGALDRAALRAALAVVVGRHAALRTVFGHDDDPYQVILPPGTVPPINEIDLSALAPEVRAAALAELSAAAYREPFDLRAAPPIRVTLIALGDDQWQLILVLHHLIADGGSVAQLIREIAEQYQHPAAALFDARPGYADFAAWQRTLLAGVVGQRASRYWQQQLTGAPPDLDLPGDLPRPAGPSGAGALHRLILPATLLDGVRAFSRRCGVTVYAAMLTAFAVLLSQRTGRRDFVVGTPVANRTDSATAEMIGLFVNTLPVRCDLGDEPTVTFAELARRISQTVVAGLSHAELPFERIVDLVQAPRDVARPPLAQVMFALQPELPDTLRFGACDARLVPAHHGTAKFDLTLSLFDNGTAVRGFLEYRTDRFSPRFAASFAADYAELLALLAADGPAPLGVQVPSERTDDVVPAAGAPAVSDQLTRKVAAIWTDLLGVDATALDADFFALGGHSLTAVRLVARLREQLGVDVPLRDLFESPQLAGFVARVERAEPATRRPALRPRPVTGPVPLAPAQERHWVLHQLDPGSTAQNVPFVLRLRGPLDLAALERALTLVAVRQAVLRTTFTLVDGVPMQLVGPPVPIHVPVFDTPTPQALAEALAEEARTPFDLGAAPPWRARLMRTTPVEHHLVLDLHHIITDGWSVAVLLTELAAYYRGEPAPEPLPVQYTDYARWRRDAEDRDDLAFWQTYLAGVPELDLPADRPRPAVARHAGGHQPIRLTPAHRAGLERIARQAGGTLFTALLTCWASTLGRYAGQRDFAVGTFHANRGPGATDGLVGFFVNNVALRCDLSGTPSWRELIGRLSGSVTSAFAYAEVPFERIVDALRVERSLRQTPLFQTMCVLQNLPQLPDDFGTVTAEYVRQPYERADFDVTLWLTEQPDGSLDGGLSYDTDLFDPATAHRLADLFTGLVDAALSNPDTSVDDSCRPLPAVVVPAVPSPTTGDFLPQRLATQASLSGAAPALIWQDGASLATMSHRELDEAANRLAHRLRAEGIGTDDRVAVLLDRSPYAVVAFIAVMRAGGAYVPIDPTYPGPRVATLLDVAAPRLVLTEERWLPLLDGRDERVLRADGDANADLPATPPMVRLHGDSLAYVIFTSGSTGRPKGVMVSHANLASYLDGILRPLDLRAEDRVLNFASVSFDASTEEIYPALLAGGSVLLRPAGLRVPDAAFDALLADGRPSVLSLPVTFWHAWTRRLAAGDGTVPTSVRALLLNAEEPAVARYREWSDAVGDRVRLINTYGPTEATVTASLYEPAHEPWHEVFQRFPVGGPLATVRPYLLDAAGRLVPVGAVGELCLGGDSITRGYLGAPGVTAAAYQPDPYAGTAGARLYRTGDLARELPDGTLLLLGRADRQVKVRGFRVELGEVEAALAAHAGITHAAVLAHDNQGVRDLVGYFCGDLAPDPDELRTHLVRRLPEHLVPARLLRVAALPLSPNGKVDLGALAARLDADLAAAAAVPAGSRHVAPRDATERSLHTIWAEVLGRADFGVRDSFFALGGDSIRGLLMINRAVAGGMRLTAQDVFLHQTIAELAVAAQEDTVRSEAPPATAAPAQRTTGLSRPQLDRALSRLKGGRP
ncbi:MAG: amino acid adenylation domain-containing protein [Hamadaea sp.]|nr:amino acid adenylation domain-containing protein [Hamadaea sp.]